jgi:hypothetical protein
MDMWDEFLLDEEAAAKIESLIDSAGHILFFKKGNELFGAGEDGRVVFAKMKHPDEEMPKNWEEEASFSADNLNKVVRGEPPQHVFHKADLDEIQIMDREEVVESLRKEAEKLGDKAFPEPRIRVINFEKLLGRGDPDDAPNFVRADEK